VSGRRKKKAGPARRKQASPPVSPAPAGAVVAEPPASAGGGAPADPPVSAGSVRTERRRRWVPWTLAVLAYAGFVVSAYLAIVHFRGYVSPCYVVSGCETVQTSKYSVVLGVPVALAGAIYFGLLFYLTVALLRGPAQWLLRAFKVLTFLGALAIIPLFLLQAIVLKAFCSYCLATEVLMLAIWILSFLLATPERSGEPLEAGAATE
jgi:uncharacterized membrane protein